MPTPIVDPPRPPISSVLPSAKHKVIKAVLDFIHAMRTAPAYGGEEAIEWATLEKEFETRLQDEQIA